MGRAYFKSNNGCIHGCNGVEVGASAIKRVRGGLAVYLSLVVADVALFPSRLANFLMPKTQRQIARATELLEPIVQARRKALAEGDSEIVSRLISSFQVRRIEQSRSLTS